MAPGVQAAFAEYVEPAWGWVIYRTVYTPESDLLWPRAIDTINTYLTRSLQKTLIESGVEQDYETMIAELENCWMDDASLFDQASFDNLRTHFASWLNTQDTKDEQGDKMLPCVRFWTFLVIDETNLKMIADAPDPNSNLVKASAKRAPMIKVVSAQRDERRLPGRTRRGPHDGKMFPGWLNCRILYLRELWEKVDEYMALYEICPNDFESESLWEP